MPQQPSRLSQPDNELARTPDQKRLVAGIVLYLSAGAIALSLVVIFIFSLVIGVNEIIESPNSSYAGLGILLLVLVSGFVHFMIFTLLAVGAPLLPGAKQQKTPTNDAQPANLAKLRSTLSLLGWGGVIASGIVLFVPTISAFVGTLVIAAANNQSIYDSIMLPVFALIVSLPAAVLLLVGGLVALLKRQLRLG